MDEILIKEINKKRFDAFAGLSRHPFTNVVCDEQKWYSIKDDQVLGILVYDIHDNDYAAIIMQPDDTGEYRATKVQDSFKKSSAAIKWLHNTMKWIAVNDKNLILKRDDKKKLDLFSDLVPIERQHPYFVRLNREMGLQPAKELIKRMMSYYIDIDGNFIEQFQSTGFESRLWELCVFAYLSEEQLFIDRSHNAPDFLVEKYGLEAAIEAVVVGRKENVPKYLPEPVNLSKEVIKNKMQNEMPIRFGSPLFSKLQKKYWELPHVSGKPLIFAIADFHDNQSMMWSGNALITYLYGIKQSYHFDEEGKLVVDPIFIDDHTYNEKSIPSGFFFQPDVENVSAVLFSSCATLSKFNRIGRQAGFNDHIVKMYRQGICHDHNPNAAQPKEFSYEVNEMSNETWAEGFSMYHNPKAKFKVPKKLFPNIAHHEYDNGQIKSIIPDFFPYTSITMNFFKT